jgi:hypothetical protein
MIARRSVSLCLASALAVLAAVAAACGSDDPPALVQQVPKVTAGSGGLAGHAGATVAGGASGGSVAGNTAVAGAGATAGGVSSGAGGTSAGSAAAGGGASAGSGMCAAGPGRTDHFSFFVTSLKGLRKLSGNDNGFGGDLRFGKSDGLSGADEICRQLAEASAPGAGCKTWRAFLSITKDANGQALNAGDRVGEGPWYDRIQRLVALTKGDLLQDWPKGADPVIAADLPNEFGVPNHNPDGTGPVDNHTTLTGTGAGGMLFSSDWADTCHDWTSSVGGDGKPVIGFSWRGGAGTFMGSSWYKSTFKEGGCAALINLTNMMDPKLQGVGSSGGYGGFYCLALQP